MSARKPRKSGTPVVPAPQPKLTLLRTRPPRPRPEPDADLQAMLDDMRRRDRVQRTRLEVEPDEPEAA